MYCLKNFIEYIKEALSDFNLYRNLKIIYNDSLEHSLEERIKERADIQNILEFNICIKKLLII